MTLEYFVEQEDVVELQEYLLARSPSQQAAVRKGQMVAAAIGMTLTLAVAFVLKWWWLAAVSPFVAAWSWLVAGRDTKLRIRKRVGEFLKEMPAEHWQAIQQVSATPDGIHVASRLGSGTMAWSLLEHVERTEHYVFLCLGGVNGLVIPHTRLQSGDLEQFLEQCQSHLRAKGA